MPRMHQVDDNTGEIIYHNEPVSNDKLIYSLDKLLTDLEARRS